MSNISIIDHDFNGTQIKQRQGDGYFDATAMCKATGKLFGNYKQLDSTKQFLTALSTDIGYPISEIIQTVKGGNPQIQGTWIHPQIAINLAQWCSPQFAVLVSKWVFELMTTGKVKLQAQSTPETLTVIPDQNLVNGMFLINASADALRMSSESRLKLLHNLTQEHGLSKNLLPAYSEGRMTKALATLLKEHHADFGAAKANKVLSTLGIIEKQTRPSTKKPDEKRAFWNITEIGLEFGKNLVSPSNQRETQPHYYVDKFQELLDRIESFLEFKL